MFLRPLALALLCAIAGISAADNQSTSIEEVVVRAGFYDTQFMKSAGSISVLDDVTIIDRSARHLDDMLGVLPNVSFTGGGGRSRFVQIRGVGDLEQFVDPKHFPSVGVTIDGIEVGTTATGATLMDVRQVEVLRGPQGTRFGANALAGMVNIKTKDPTNELSGYVNSGYANFDTWHVGGALSGGLSDNVAGRITVQQFTSDGFIDNSFLGTDNTADRDEFSTRTKLHWSVGEGADVRLTASYADIDNGYDAFSLENSRNTRSDRPGSDEQETLALGLSSNWNVYEGVQLETFFSWHDSDEQYGFDEDWLFAGFCDGVRCSPFVEFENTDLIERERDVIAADVRLKSDPQRISWVVGLYTQHRDEDIDRQYFGPFSSEFDTERYAAYGQLIVELSPKWVLTTGVRLEHYEDEYSDSNGLATDSDDDYWTGEVTLEHFYSDDVLFYATLSRGVKPGSINSSTSSNLPFVAPTFQSFLVSRQRFSSETLFNKEIGMKGLFLDDRLQMRLTGFHMDRYDAQLESFVFDPSTFVFTSFLDSTSNAENYGAEFETSFTANEFVEFFANVGYLETEVDQLTVFDLDLLAFRISSGRDQAKSPNWTYNTGFNFTVNDRLRGRVEVEGRDKNFFGYYHNGEIEAYTLTHASMSYVTGNVTIQAWVRNLFDANNEVHGLYFANDPRDVFSVNRSYFQRGEPRVFGVNLNYAF
ncbi:MAG: TonB-dependent receptor [Gammaproteobacteria bacterium]